MLVSLLRQRVSVSYQVKGMLSELHNLSQTVRAQGMSLPSVAGSQDLPSYNGMVTGWTEVTKEVLAAQAASEGAEDDMMIDREMERELRAVDGGDEEGEVLSKVEPTEPATKNVIHATQKHAAQMARKGHRFFRATLSKTLPAAAGTWLVQADVEMPGGYPKAPPVWSLKVVQRGSSKLNSGAGLSDADPIALAAAAAARQRGEETNTQLKSIEDELNYYASSQAAAHGCPGAKLLVYQLWVAVHCFAMYVDTESGQSVPTSREHRGRDRRLPFLWNVQTKSQEQRT